MSKPIKVIVMPDKIVNRQSRRRFKVPRCDKCHKNIEFFGKYLKEDGIYKFVHQSYNPETGECWYMSEYKCEYCKDEINIIVSVPLSIIIHQNYHMIRLLDVLVAGN